MAVRIEDFTMNVRNATRQRASIFLRLAADHMMQIARPVTPKRDNFLRKDVLRTVIGLHGTVEWRKGYAAVQERGQRNGVPFKNYTTPGTGPHFAENAAKQTVRDTQRIAKLANLI